MHCLDVTSSPRLTGLLETLKRISQCDDPSDLIRLFSEGLQQFVPFEALFTLSTRELPDGKYKITRKVWAPDFFEEINPWEHLDEIPTNQGGFLGDVIADARPEIIHDLYLRGDPVLGDELAELGSCMVMPVFERGKARQWSLILNREREAYTTSHLETALLITNLVGRTTRHLVTSRQVSELNDRITSQLEQVAALQQSMLPQTLPRIRGVDIGCFYKPCEQAGGDYYDFAPVDVGKAGRAAEDGRWGFIIADVSGHGASAAVIVAMLQTLVHAYPGLPESPARMLREINRHLASERLDSNFVTAFAGVFDPRSRDLTYACAGHYPPRLKKPGELAPVQSLPLEPAIPLGITTDFDIADYNHTLEEGDTLILYTDGIIESFDRRREMFGVHRLDDAILHCSGEPDCVVDSVQIALREHEQGARPADDQTLLALKVRSNHNDKAACGGCPEGSG